VSRLFCTSGTWLPKVHLIHIFQVSDPWIVGVVPNDAVFRGVEAQVGLVAGFAECLDHFRCEICDAGCAEEAVK
jgi:hypothetical protein